MQEKDSPSTSSTNVHVQGQLCGNISLNFSLDPCSMKLRPKKITIYVIIVMLENVTMCALIAFSYDIVVANNYILCTNFVNINNTKHH